MMKYDETQYVNSFISNLNPINLYCFDFDTLCIIFIKQNQVQSILME